MQEIMTVFDTLESPDGLPILCGVNPDFDVMSIGQIRKAVGDTVRIRRLDGARLKTNIIGIDVSESLAGKKNLFLSLPRATHKSFVQKNVVVYSCQNK